MKTVSGLNRCGSPSRRHWYSPPIGRRLVPGISPPTGYAIRWRAIVSSAITSKLIPPRRDVVPTKYSSTTSCDKPIASNT